MSISQLYMTFQKGNHPSWKQMVIKMELVNRVHTPFIFGGN